MLSRWRPMRSQTTMMLKGLALVALLTFAFAAGAMYERARPPGGGSGRYGCDASFAGATAVCKFSCLHGAPFEVFAQNSNGGSVLGAAECGGTEARCFAKQQCRATSQSAAEDTKGLLGECSASRVAPGRWSWNYGKVSVTCG